jgi:hypothetical protein
LGAGLDESDDRLGLSNSPVPCVATVSTVIVQVVATYLDAHGSPTPWYRHHYPACGLMLAASIENGWRDGGVAGH